MCGIAGYLNFDPERPIDRGVLERMTRTLVHRGPDEEGYFVDGPVGLGMRRLRVIDLDGGRQPLANEDRTVWVVFNGEIYNFDELRRQLEHRHTFRTRSDTEVIVHLYEEYGPSCTRALRGMFAFALWDARRRRLLLARDHLGEKPLYYARTRDALWFGSELKALLAAPAVGRTVDFGALDDYLALGYVPAPGTIFREIQKLPPGSYLQVQGGPVLVRRYWRLDWTPRGPDDEATATAAVHERLEDSVRRRLVADVPLGAFLSGGIDSTTVTWLMRRASAGPVKTFSIGFDEPAFDELPYARAVARALDTDHYEQVVKPDALALLPELVEHFDEPFGDASAIPTYLLSRLARQHVTVALSGDGGDEAFAGYERYRKAYLVDRLRPFLLGAPGASLGAWLTRLVPVGRRPLRRVGAALARAALPALERYTAMVGLCTPDVRAALFSGSPGAWRVGATPASLATAWNDAVGLDPIRRLQAVDTETYLPDDILVKVDRASMAVSLEARAPLLDYRLLEYVAGLPTSLKMRAGDSKWILRRILAGNVPPAVLTRPKQGFAVPLARWLRDGWRDTAREMLLDGPLGQHFSRRAVEKMFAEHVRGDADRSEPLWLLLVFAGWHARYVGAR
ncbi:MAG TPA: asparagine synthase (glutamine-hydrolyzing) [Methylomirabilota bacterium]|jgi:asparagine synthase (glutamine-hydrolysing)|nr:asparagine synthase (glutamine-hydrolyzing) [Methylomirabilota bacterium]